MVSQIITVQTVRQYHNISIIMCHVAVDGMAWGVISCHWPHYRRTQHSSSLPQEALPLEGPHNTYGKQPGKYRSIIRHQFFKQQQGMSTNCVEVQAHALS